MAILALPYYPSKSKEYKRIWSRCKHQSTRYVICFDRKNYQKKYYSREDVKERTRRSLARLSIINMLGGQCNRCGMNDLRCLQLDHKNGGGAKDTRASAAVYRRLLKDPVKLNMKYQLLCANCNWIKRYENQESYHLMPYGPIGGI